MSPTVLRVRGYRFYFYSREEARAHVHVTFQGNEAKFWLVPRVTLAANWGLQRYRLATAKRLIEEHCDEILAKWQKHISG